MRILITAGPTREHLDTVRFLSNPSSGRMGYAIAAEAAARGHEVILISGPVEQHPPANVQLVRVTSAAEMLAASLNAFATCDAAIMTAAVCDYRPTQRRDKKIAKETRTFSIDLEPTEDICARLGLLKGRRVVIGFALEDHDHLTHAEEKLKRKHCDAIVMNDVRTVGSATAEVRFLRADIGWQPQVGGTKEQVAQSIVALAEALFARH